MPAISLASSAERLFTSSVIAAFRPNRPAICSANPAAAASHSPEAHTRRALRKKTAKVRQAILGGFAQSKILEAHGQKMLERNFRPGFRIRLHDKDMRIALSAGSEYGVPLMVTSQVAQIMTAMKSMGHGELDHSALVKFVEELAKIELPQNT